MKLLKKMPCNLCGNTIQAVGTDAGNTIKWTINCPICANTRVVEEAKPTNSVSLVNSQRTEVLPSVSTIKKGKK